LPQHCFILLLYRPKNESGFQLLPLPGCFINPCWSPNFSSNTVNNLFFFNPSVKILIMPSISCANFDFQQVVPEVALSISPSNCIGGVPEGLMCTWLSDRVK
jgi:hypothetical protein